MYGDLEQLLRRIEKLEIMEREYAALRQLLDAAANNENLDKYGAHALLYVDTVTRQIVDANPDAVNLLGFDIHELRAFRIDEIEVVTDEAGHATYTQNASQTEIYRCSYRHRDQHLIPVRVHRRLISDDSGGGLLQYSLEEISLRWKLWAELSRREDRDFHFREKLKNLNEINLELAEAESLHELCRLAIQLGMEKLDFDRLSIWFHDENAQVMVGTYGVDEAGAVRDERHIRWSYAHTPVVDFIEGRNNLLIVQDNAPIYNHLSQVIAYGWHVSVPLLHRGQCIGFMTADNFINRHSLKDYQPELLRLYGITVGHLAAHQRQLEAARQNQLELRLEQERNRMLETFIRDIGHEFRTPLSIINVKSYLIKKTEDASKRDQFAQNIQEQVGVISAMIDSLIYIVKLENGDNLKLSRVDMKSLVEAVVTGLTSFARGRMIHFQLLLPGVPPIQGDSEKLTRAIHEIAKNAVQYSPPNSTVTISLQGTAGHVILRIQDQGIGLAQGEIDKIFNRLYRVDQARTGRGAGLGLSIARRIVEAHHGTISVESAPGQGSTFEIRLPAPNG